MENRKPGLPPYQGVIKTEKNKASGKIEKQSILKKAIIWKEILSAPVSLKNPDDFF